MCLFSCTRACLCSIWLGGEIRSRLQKVGRRQGHPDPARSGEDLRPHRRGTFSMPASGLSDTPLFTRRGSRLCPLWRAALHADTRPPLHKLLSVIDSFLPQTKGHSPSSHSLRQVAPQMFLYFCFMMQSLKRCRTAFSTYLRSLVRKWETEYSYPLSYNRIYSMDRCHSTNCTWPDLCPLSLTTAHPLKDCICAAVAVTQVGLYLWIIKL